LATEKIILSERSHPLYDKYESQWDMYYNAARGGDSFITQDNLSSHRLEDPEDYDERLRRGYFLNFCDTIPKIYNAFIFKERIERPPDTELDLFRNNTDRRGTSISDFVKKAGYWASVFGVIHALIDMPTSSKKVISKRQEKDMGLYPYATLFFPTQIKDWSIDKSGMLRWIIIETPYFNDLDPNKEREDTVHYRLITTTEWRIEDEDGLPVKFDDGSPNKGKNELGAVPLVTMYGNSGYLEDMIGESLIKDIVYINKAILNYCSCIDEQIERQTFSQLTVPDDGTLAEEQERGDDPLHKLGTSTIWTYAADAKNPPAFISPHTDNIKTIWGVTLDLVKEIYRLAGLQGGTSDLYTSRSGRQSQMSFVGVNSSLAEKSNSYQQFENELCKMAYMQLGKNVDVYKNVKYPNSFDVIALETEIKSSFDIMERNFSPTLNKVLMKNIARRVASSSPPDIRETIEDEIESEDGIVETISKSSFSGSGGGEVGNPNSNQTDSFENFSGVDEKKVGHRPPKKY